MSRATLGKSMLLSLFFVIQAYSQPCFSSEPLFSINSEKLEQITREYMEFKFPEAKHLERQKISLVLGAEDVTANVVEVVLAEQISAAEHQQKRSSKLEKTTFSNMSRNTEYFTIYTLRVDAWGKVLGAQVGSSAVFKPQ